MNCSSANEYIMKFFDGKCSDIEYEELKNHLNECEEYKKAFDELDEIFNILKTEEVEPPENFEAEVMKKVEAYERKRKKKAEIFMITVYSIATAAVVALTMLLVSSSGIDAVWRDITETITSFESFKDFTSAVGDVTGKFFIIVLATARALFDVGVVIINEYYYIIVAVGILFVLAHRTFVYLTNRSRSNGGAS